MIPAMSSDRFVLKCDHRSPTNLSSSSNFVSDPLMQWSFTHLVVKALKTTVQTLHTRGVICPWTKPYRCFVCFVYLNKPWFSPGDMALCHLGQHAWTLVHTGGTEHGMSFLRSKSLFRRLSPLPRSSQLTIDGNSDAISVNLFNGFLPRFIHASLLCSLSQESGV